MTRSQAQIDSNFEDILSRLSESHDVSVYEGIERLVQAGEDVGYDAGALLRKLDQGMTLEELLELIESKLEHLQRVA